MASTGVPENRPPAYALETLWVLARSLRLPACSRPTLVATRGSNAGAESHRGLEGQYRITPDQGARCGLSQFLEMRHRRSGPELLSSPGKPAALQGRHCCLPLCIREADRND